MTKTNLSQIKGHLNFYFIILFSMITILFEVGICSSEQITKPKVAVVVSREIKPYMEAVGGLKDILDKKAGGKFKIFPLEEYRENDLDLLEKQLNSQDFNLAVSVGPEATSFLWSGSKRPDLLRVFTMVLSPEKILPKPERACGISLSIPIDRQLKVIAESLPFINRLGLLFNPKYNLDFYQFALGQAQPFDLEVVPLKIDSQKEIPKILEKSWSKIDGVWLIPDRTVISKSVAEYIIKEALYEEKPVIGYNRFFYESGSAMAFVLDYPAIGQQTGQLALNRLKDQPCEEIIPAFQIKINSNVLENMGYKP